MTPSLIVFVTVLILGLVASMVTSAPAIAKLVLIDTKRFPKAICLDQTPGGRYEYLSTDPSSSHQVFLHLEGGAWATTEADAYSRSQGALGSSKFWNPQQDISGLGIVAPNCDFNPEFCKMSYHVLKYCDGMSFGGYNSFDYQGHKVTMYGDAVMSGHINEIFEKVTANMQRTGNTRRPEVVISGCSAGGFASLANTWKIDQMAKAAFGNPIVSTIPCSGIFPATTSVDGAPNYPNWMTSGYQLAKPRYSPDDTTVHPCIAKFGDDDAGKCMFGETHLRLIETPVFVINSVIDSWSLPCIYGSKPPLSCSGIPAWSSCVKAGLVNCTASQVQLLKDSWIPTLLNAADAPPDTTFINSPIDSAVSSQTYHNLATEVAWEQNRAMFAFVNPADDRIHIEPVPTDVDRAVRQVALQGRRMTADDLVLIRQLTAEKYNPSTKVTTSGLALPPGSGAFLHTCYTHCEGSSGNALNFQIDGVSIVKAVNSWYSERVRIAHGEMIAVRDQPFGTTPHVYLPCTLQSLPDTAQCNRSCGGS